MPGYDRYRSHPLGDTWRADRIDVVSRRIADRVEREHGVVLTAIGVYSLNVSDDGTALVREPVVTAVRETEHVLSIHGFYCDETEKTVRFDVVVDFGVQDEEKLKEDVVKAAETAAPGYSVSVHVDYDYSD